MALALFLTLVAVIAVGLAIATRGDGRPSAGRDPLDPDRMRAALAADEELSEEERRWLDELATLELPRRHRIC